MMRATALPRCPRGLRTFVTTIAALALAAALVGAAGASALSTTTPAGWRTCGADHHREAGWYGVIERGTSCHQARRLARRWWHANPTWGFDCVVVDRRDAGGRVLCHRVRDGALEQVRFSYSAAA